jgi:hypothetical protein
MTTLASSNRASLAYVAETAFGSVPVAGSPAALRFTGESFDFSLSKEVSKEIRQDRQNSGATTVDASASGGFNFEAQYREYDTLLAAAMQGAWSVFGTNGISTSFTADFTATTITASVAPTGSSALTGLQKGQWFRMTTGGANNGKLFRVSTTTAPTTTVITLDPSTPAVVASGVATCAIQASRLTNGTTLTTFSVEKAFNDIAQFFTYRGMAVNKMSLAFASGAMTTGSFEFMGKDVVRNGATQMPGGAGAIAASQTYNVQNGVKGMNVLWEGGAPLTSTFVKKLDLSVDNSLRAQTALANLGAVGLGVGDFNPTGSFDVYLADGTLYDKMLGDVYTSLSFATQDTAGNGYVVTLPRIQLMTGKILAGSKNQDVMAQFTFTGFADLQNATAALQQTIFIDRVGV